jgi:hypothetical protein
MCTLAAARMASPALFVVRLRTLLLGLSLMLLER